MRIEARVSITGLIVVCRGDLLDIGITYPRLAFFSTRARLVSGFGVYSHWNYEDMPADLGDLCRVLGEGHVDTEFPVEDCPWRPVYDRIVACLDDASPAFREGMRGFLGEGGLA